MKLHVFAAAAVLSFAGVVRADVNWKASNGGGEYDLGAESTWVENKLPTSSDKALLATMPSGTYTLKSSGDVSFKTFSFKDAKAKNITFDLGVGNTMHLAGSGLKDTSTINANISSSSLTLASGTIQARSTGDYLNYLMCNVIQSTNTFLIDGSDSRFIIDVIKFVPKDSLFCVTNGGYVQGGLIASQSATMKDTVIQVTGEGSMWNLHDDLARTTIDNVEIQSPLCLAHGGTGCDNDVLLKVDHKGVITNVCGFVGGNASGSKMLVDDGTVYARGTVSVGNGVSSHGNSVTVCNGGLWNGLGSSRVYVGTYGSLNAFSIDGAGSTGTCSTVYLGAAHTATSNTIEITRGGVLNVKEVFSVGETGKWSRVSVYGAGSGVTCANLYIGRRVGAADNVMEVTEGGTVTVQRSSEFRPFARGHNNRLTISGADSKLEFFGKVYVGGEEANAEATNNVIEVTDGGLLEGVHRIDGWSVMYLNNRGNKVSVRGGGKIDVGQYTMGMSGNDHSLTNALEILGDGSELYAREFMTLNGIGNTVVISNGLLKANGHIRFNDTPNHTATLVLEGVTPRVEAAAYTNRNTTLVFKIPEGGFAEGPIIKATKDLHVDESCSLEIVAEHNSDGTAVLMQCTNKALSIADSVIANARFTGSKAKVYRLVKSVDGKQLLLKPSNGTLLIFR